MGMCPSLVQQKGTYSNEVNGLSTTMHIQAQRRFITTCRRHVKFSQRQRGLKTPIPWRKTWQLKAYFQHYRKSTSTMLLTASLSQLLADNKEKAEVDSQWCQ